MFCVYVPVCLVVFRGLACVHEALKLPWLGDKRPDYSTWHPLVWRCLNIVQYKSDPELLSFIFLSSSPPLSPVFVLFLAEREICVPAQIRGLKTELFFIYF